MDQCPTSDRRFDLKTLSYETCSLAKKLVPDYKSDTGVSHDDTEPPLEYGVDSNGMRDSDNETYDPANPDHNDYF